MPFSRSRSPESSTRSTTASLARNAPVWRSIASTSVVLPWSTWATIATLRRSWRTVERRVGAGDGAHGPRIVPRKYRSTASSRHSRVPAASRVAAGVSTGISIPLRATQHARLAIPVPLGTAQSQPISSGAQLAGRAAIPAATSHHYLRIGGPEACRRATGPARGRPMTVAAVILAASPASALNDITAVPPFASLPIRPGPAAPSRSSWSPPIPTAR